MAIEDGESHDFSGDNQKQKPISSLLLLGEESSIPPWLVSLLKTKFFSLCSSHSDSNRNECNLYCLDCPFAALCSFCLPNHTEHRIVQIRKSSYHNVIKASEISKFMDISGVQTYVINSARIVFLNDRPQARLCKGAAFWCRICSRPLLDSHRFCSIGCKVRGVHEDRRTVALDFCGGVESQPSVDSDSGHRRSRRKGIPRRASF